MGTGGMQARHLRSLFRDQKVEWKLGGDWISIPFIPIKGLKNTFLWNGSSISLLCPGQTRCSSFSINNLQIGLRTVDIEMLSGFNQDIYESS